MDKGGFIRGLLIAILFIAIVGGAAFYAYQAGIAQGLVDSGKLVAPTAPIPPYAYYGRYHFGFGALGCLVPIFLIFLFFGFARLFFHGHWGWKGHHGHWDAEERGVPPKVEEWHRKLHEPQQATPK